MKPWITRRENQTGSPHQPGGMTLTLPPVPETVCNVRGHPLRPLSRLSLETAVEAVP